MTRLEEETTGALAKAVVAFEHFVAVSEIRLDQIRKLHGDEAAAQARRSLDAARAGAEEWFAGFTDAMVAMAANLKLQADGLSERRPTLRIVK